jgi:nucleoside-diphosphate-sugar epimerase
MKGQNPRWLILGASGWFGRTALALAPRDADVLPISGSSSSFATWSEPMVREFAPTHVLGCAFLTKEKAAQMSADEYWSTNRTLIERFSFASRQDSCHSAISLSSGSVVSDPDHPYSQLKVLEEEVSRGLVSEDRGSVTIRVFSVSGPYVQRIHDYAFSDLLAQGLAGNSPIRVRTQSAVWRRYVDVGDVLTVALGLAKPGQFRRIDSGGPLVELHDLARLMGDELGTDVDNPFPNSGPASVYASDNYSWEEACRELGFTPADLVTQIRRTTQGCRLQQIHVPGRR